MNIVFGGSFNPPTKAHKLILDKLFLLFIVPVGDNYQKKGLIDYTHRLEMVKLLDSRVIVSTLENNDVYLGTYDLLKKLSEDYDDLYYVIGSDNLMKLDTWIDYKNLLKDFKFIVFNRYSVPLEDVILEKYPEFKDRFLIIQIDYDISSSKFRETKDANLIPSEVYDYIIENKLYEVK
jgi:nicotinate-nucleotide adenylyltransferase